MWKNTVDQHRPQCQCNTAHALCMLGNYSYTHTHTTGRTLLKGGRYLHKTQQTQEANNHDFSGIRTHDPRNQAAAGLCLRPYGHLDLKTKRTHIQIPKQAVSYLICKYFSSWKKEMLQKFFQEVWLNAEWTTLTKRKIKLASLTH
jgi:hypothetical protein